jgi:hypothetical protein
MRIADAGSDTNARARAQRGFRRAPVSTPVADSTPTHRRSSIRPGATGGGASAGARWANSTRLAGELRHRLRRRNTPSTQPVAEALRCTRVNRHVPRQGGRRRPRVSGAIGRRRRVLFATDPKPRTSATTTVRDDAVGLHQRAMR